MPPSAPSRRRGEPGQDDLAPELAEGVGGDPPGRGRTLLPDPLRARYSRCVEAKVPLPDRSKRPVHRLLHEVAAVTGLPLDHAEQLDERLRWGLLVMNGQGRDQGEGRPLDEFLGPGAPVEDLRIREGRSIEEVAATLIDQIP